MQVNPALRPLSPESVPQVQEIEREAFPGLWPPTSFKRELGDRRVAYLVAWLPRHDVLQPEGQEAGVPGGSRADGGVRPIIWRFVSGVRGLLTSGQAPDTEDLVVGFVGLWFGVDEAHVTAIAVRERWRGLGIGELLLIGAVELVLARRVKVLTLEVRASNPVAQSLYAKYGFKNVGVRKGYYNDNGEDAVIMTTEPTDSPAFTELFQRQMKTYRQRRGEVVMELPSPVHETTQA